MPFKQDLKNCAAGAVGGAVTGMGTCPIGKGYAKCIGQRAVIGCSAAVAAGKTGEVFGAGKTKGKSTTKPSSTPKHSSKPKVSQPPLSFEFGNRSRLA